MARTRPKRQLVRCECGNRKHPSNMTCRRCAFLDGQRPTVRSVITLMRVRERVTVADVARLGLAKESAHRTLNYLAKTGRARRDVDDYTGIQSFSLTSKRDHANPCTT